MTVCPGISGLGTFFISFFSVLLAAIAAYVTYKKFQGKNKWVKLSLAVLAFILVFLAVFAILGTVFMPPCIGD